MKLGFDDETYADPALRKELESSMLEQAAQLHDQMRKLKQEDSGKDHRTFLQRPYAQSQPRTAVSKAPVWFTAYMPSIIGAEDDGEMKPPLETLCDLHLWQHFADLGIKAVHTGPVMKAGGSYLDGTVYPSIDGWFDPVALEIDPVLGTERDYSRLVWIAENVPDEQGRRFDGCIIGDIVPGHTGMGPDFHLALKGVGHYPGLYVLARVDQVLRGEDRRSKRLSPEQNASLTRDFGGPGQEHEFTRLLTEDEVEALVAARVIPGKLQRSLGVQAGLGWSITKELDGVPDESGCTKRRWVYLHFFHPKQPTLNFLDPSYSAWRMVTGQLNYVLWNLRSNGVRLDANAFLGIEPCDDENDRESGRSSTATWSEAHPLSYTVTNMLAWQARRLGGFSFQEMNMAVPDIARSFQFGPDLAYDFISRPACEHALLTGDVSLLKFMYGEMKKAGIDTGCLVHALQNHDEITYEMVHLHHLEGMKSDDQSAPAASFTKTAAEVRAEMRRVGMQRTDPTDSLEGRIASSFYNQESSNGLCTTMAGLIAARLGCTTIFEAFDKDKARQIQQGHMLLAAFNALQPGVFALSGWDIVGALPVLQERVPPILLNAGPTEKDALEKDYRWINRGAYRLLSTFGPTALDENKRFGCFNLPEAQRLYGTMDQQKVDAGSFYNRLKHLLAIRAGLEIATGDFAGVLNGLEDGLFGFRVWLTSAKSRDRRLGAAVVFCNFNGVEREPLTIDVGAVLRAEWPELDLAGFEIRDASLDQQNHQLSLTKSDAPDGIDEEQAIAAWEWKCFYLRPIR